jgi:hypothetical protein
MIIVTLLMSFIMAGLFNIFRQLTHGGAVRITNKLTLQLEARRALTNLYQEVQEGIELLKPDPGSTLPFAVLRSGVNNVHFLYLKRDDTASARHQFDLFRLYSVIYDVETAQTGTPREILAGIETLNFTAHGYGALLVTSTLREGQESFSFVNMIRLKNLTAEEGL